MENKKVLIADDEPMIREGLATMISGFELPLEIAGEAKNGLEALRMAKLLEPDLILTDICMPKLSGLEFLKRLKEEKQLDCKVIIISGYNEFEYAREAITLGVSAYLLKPVNEEELKKTIKAYLSIETAGEAGRTVSYQNKMVDDCIDILKSSYYTGDDADVDAAAEKLSVDPDYLSGKLKQETGMSFKEWKSKLRIHKSIELIKSRQYSMGEISEMVGYDNSSSFLSAFKSYTGYSPTQYQELEYEKTN